MNQHNELPSSTASAATKAVIKELSFCKTTPRDLANWLLSLPKANTGEYSRQLYMALSELSNLKAAPDLRLQLLELMRPEVAQITRQLETNHLVNSVILSARANQIANLCQSLQHHLNGGYKQVVADLQHKRSSQLTLAIQRSLHGLFTTLARSYLTYRSMPTGLWFEIHQMYRLAAHHNLQRQKVKDPLLDGDQTLEHAYCCALLLGCSRANQLRQGDIKILVDALPEWCELVRLQHIDDEDSLFAVALSTDTPPRYRTLLRLEGQANILGLNTKRLTDSMEEALKERDKGVQGHSMFGSQIPLQLMQQLFLAWGDIAKRDFPRTASDESMEFCLGMSAVHFHLAGGLTFEETLDHPPKEDGLQLIIPEDNPGPTDIWSQAVDAFQDEVIAHHESIEYTSPEDLARQEEEKQQQLEAQREQQAAQFPVQSTHVVNHSPGGYCLEWLTDAPPNLRTGDVLALRQDATDSWSVAVIRWIRQNTEGGARIGVELLSPRAQPCGTQLLRSGKAASDYLRALRIPEIGALAQPAQLVTVKVPFREGSTVTLNIRGEESRIVLGKLVQQTASYNIFYYAVSQAAQPTPKPVEPAAQSTSAASGHATVDDQEDFTSLWDIL